MVGGGSVLTEFPGKWNLVYPMPVLPGSRGKANPSLEQAPDGVEGVRSCSVLAFASSSPSEL